MKYFYGFHLAPANRTCTVYAFETGTNRRAAIFKRTVDRSCKMPERIRLQTEFLKSFNLVHPLANINPIG